MTNRFFGAGVDRRPLQTAALARLARLARRSWLVIALAGGLPAAHAAEAPGSAAVRVEFVDAAHFSDAGDMLGGRPDERLLGVLQAQLERSVAQCLPAGQSVLIRVLDVDLAGRVEPRWRHAVTPVRVLREQDWPRIELATTLTRDGQAGAEVREVVSDPAFMMGGLGSAHALADGERLPHERAMLARWAATRLCAPAKGAIAG